MNIWLKQIRNCKQFQIPSRSVRNPRIIMANFFCCFHGIAKLLLIIASKRSYYDYGCFVKKKTEVQRS